MSFPRYERYKDSGVAWLGEVPAHWHVTALGWALSRNDGGAWGDEPDGENDVVVLRSTEQTATGEWRIDDPCMRKLTATERAATLLAEGDLLVTKSSGSALHIGKTTIVNREIAERGCGFSNFMQRLRLHPSILLPLGWYILNSDASRYQFDILSNSTSGLANINSGIIERLVALLPPVGDQVAIVSFLDEEAPRIDALIGEQRRLIDLLKEKRQALISHAVTNGLHANVPMKDSGVEWLGDTPEHWKSLRMTAIYKEINDLGVEGLPILSVSIHHGVSDKQLDDDELDRQVIRSDDQTKYKRVRSGDLVYNMMRAWQGGFGTVNVEGMVSPAYVVARPANGFSSRFVELLLRTPCAIEEMRRYSKGVTDFRLRLYWDEFKRIRLYMPPKSEQETILHYVESKTAEFDKLTEASEKAIAILQERRSALISAAVNGKIDVRNYAPKEAK